MEIMTNLVGINFSLTFSNFLIHFLHSSMNKVVINWLILRLLISLYDAFRSWVRAFSSIKNNRNTAAEEKIVFL